jgi:hypothetical protein
MVRYSHSFLVYFIRSDNFTFPNYVLQCTYGLSNESATNTLHSISGPFPSTGYESAFYNKIHELCNNKPLVHLDEGWMIGLASISEPESHDGASLATRQGLGDLTMTKALVFQAENLKLILKSSESSDCISQKG